MTNLMTLTDENSRVQGMLHLMQVGDAVIKYLDNRLFLELGTSYIKYSVLKALVRNKGTLRHTDIARWTNTKKHNITALVERMEKEDLVTTEYSQVDRRVNNIIITPKGRNLFKKADPLVTNLLENLMQNYNKEKDVNDLSRLLDLIVKKLD
jgi:DNA-binding MarR family transcriptional regulator